MLATPSGVIYQAFRTTHATKMPRRFPAHPSPDNRDTLWKQYKNGDEEAGAAYQKGIILNPNPISMELKLQ